MSPLHRPANGARSVTRRLLGFGVAASVVAASMVLGHGSAWAQPRSLTDCPLLIEGQSSPCVQLLQESLNRLDVGYGLTADGEFGAATRIALLDFQGRNRLPADGNAGPETLSALSLQTETVASPSPGATLPTPPVTVALGDSFSSGEGADYEGGAYDPGTASRGNGCHRSGSAWPRQLGVPAEQHLACSGATSNSIVAGGEKDTEGSQIERLRSIDRSLRDQGRRVELVTVTVGGNDLNFSGIIGDCWKNDNCLAGFMKDIDRHEATLEAGAGYVVDRIGAAAPDAEVVLVGYPRLVPQIADPAVKCGWLTPVERGRVDELAERLDSTLRAVAEAKGVRYVSTLSSLAGHELCTADSWVVPVQPLARSPKRPEQGHPTSQGQDAIAATVRAALAP